MTALIGYAREDDVIVVHTLDRLGRTVRTTVNDDPRERGVRMRNLADPIHVDSANLGGPIAQLAVLLLALFGQMKRFGRANHVRAPDPSDRRTVVPARTRQRDYLGVGFPHLHRGLGKPDRSAQSP